MKASELTRLKDKIKKKHKSLSRFARLVHDNYDDQIDEIVINRFFAGCHKELVVLKHPVLSKDRAKFAKKLDSLCDRSNSKKQPDNEVSLDDQLKLKKAIEKAGGVQKFCSDNPKFNPFSTYQIMNGVRTRKTKKVMSLLKFLKIC